MEHVQVCSPEVGDNQLSPSYSDSDENQHADRHTLLPEPNNGCEYEFSVPQDKQTDPSRFYLDQELENITHDGCVIMDTAEDLGVEFSLLLISTGNLTWNQDENFDNPDRFGWSSRDSLSIAFGALAVAATGRLNEYRRIGYADIHDRRFFAGTQDIEVSIV